MLSIHLLLCPCNIEMQQFAVNFRRGKRVCQTIDAGVATTFAYVAFRNYWFAANNRHLLMTYKTTKDKNDEWYTVHSCTFTCTCTCTCTGTKYYFVQTWVNEADFNTHTLSNQYKLQIQNIKIDTYIYIWIHILYSAPLQWWLQLTLFILILNLFFFFLCCY